MLRTIADGLNNRPAARLGYGAQAAFATHTYKIESMMSERTYTVQLKDREVAVTSTQLATMRQMYVADDLNARMAELLWLDMYILDAVFGVSVHEVLKAIKDVENGDLASSGVKSATQFKHMPLKGLWHKHYFSAHFLVENMVLGLGKNGLEKLINEVMDPTKSPIVTKEMVEELAHRVTEDPVRNRHANKALTGEWVIYVRHGEKNYYLCCNTHDAGDQVIYERIVQNCVRDFPDLLTWLQKAQS